MRRPGFFIVGAPRCGTTSLYHYLVTHPSIFLPEIKEPHHFSTDLCDRFPGIKDRQAYLELFLQAEPRHLAVGEASTSYLWSGAALANLRDFNPEAKIIVLVRNPVEAVISLHAELMTSLEETEGDFERAWDLQDTRLAGNHIPPKCHEPRRLQYREMGRLGTQVERALGIFPRKQVKLLVFDDLRSDPRKIYTEVLTFLGVPDDGREEFQVYNARSALRSGNLEDVLRRPPKALSLAVGGLGRALGLGGRGLGKKLWSLLSRLNRRKKQTGRESAGFRVRLERAFAPEVDKLSKILGRDLSSWKGAER